MQQAGLCSGLLLQTPVHVLHREISFNEISATLVRVRCRMQPKAQLQRLHRHVFNCNDTTKRLGSNELHQSNWLWVEPGIIRSTWQHVMPCTGTCVIHRWLHALYETLACSGPSKQKLRHKDRSKCSAAKSAWLRRHRTVSAVYAA